MYMFIESFRNLTQAPAETVIKSLLHDACGQREVYYFSKINKFPILYVISLSMSLFLMQPFICLAVAHSLSQLSNLVWQLTEYNNDKEQCNYFH